LCFLALEIRGFWRRFAALICGVLVGLLILPQFGKLEEKTFYRMNKLFDTSHSAAGRTSGRADLAIGGWRIFLEHPLGVGTGAYADYWAKLDNREGLSGFARGKSFPSHSGWIKVLVENGVVGILLFAAFAISFAIVGCRRKSWRLFTIGLLTTSVLCVALIATEFQSRGLWLLVAGAITLLHRQHSGDVRGTVSLA
jgi:O-antigen ligase